LIQNGQYFLFCCRPPDYIFLFLLGGLFVAGGMCFGVSGGLWGFDLFFIAGNRHQYIQGGKPEGQQEKDEARRGRLMMGIRPSSTLTMAGLIQYGNLPAPFQLALLFYFFGTPVW